MKKFVSISMAVLSSLMLVSCLSPNGSSTKNVKSDKRQDQQAPAQSQGDATQTTTAASPFAEYPVVNVYLETSGSMNGYVDNGKSQLQQAVYDYVSNISNSHVASALNLYYITDVITPKGTDIKSFINNLTPSNILKAQGNHATTDVAELFANVLSKTDNNTVSVLISDCLFSPGSVSDPDSYLENQKITIRNAVKNYLDTNVNLACCVYQFNSNFKGKFFDYKNRGRMINQPRPFYIWVFGNVPNIYKLRYSIPQEKFMGAPVENYWAIYNSDGLDDQLNPKYGLLRPNPRNGQYRWNQGNRISNLAKNSDGMFEFSFGADMGLMATILGKEYVEDLDNYKNLINHMGTDEFKSSVEDNLVKDSPFTHDYHIYSDMRPSNGKVEIVFDGNVPQWVYDITDDNDSVFDGTNDLKTYGFSNICDGIYAGFHANNTNNITAAFEFEIK